MEMERKERKIERIPKESGSDLMPDLWNVGSASVQLIKLIRSIYMQPESQHYLSLSLSLSLSSSFSLYFSSHSHQLK